MCKIIQLCRTKIIPMLSVLFMLSMNSQIALASTMHKNLAEKPQSLHISSSQKEEESNETDIGLPGDQLNIDVSYDYLDPNSAYGDWKALNFSYYDKISNDLTMLYQGSVITRIEGDAVLGAVGIYKGWGERFYTFTQFSAGTNSEYLPAFRLDQEFNYKFGEKKNIVGLLGFTYLKQYDQHEEFMGSLGITYYSEGYTIGYRAFLHKSNPGSVYSTSHIVSLEVGHEKDQWVSVDFSYGNPAYLLITVPSNNEVKENTLGISLKYKKWLNTNSGFYTQTGFFNLESEYEKYNFGIGYFREF